MKLPPCDPCTPPQVTPDGKRKVKSLKSMRELREAASASLPPSSDSPLSPRERHHDSLALQKKVRA